MSKPLPDKCPRCFSLVVDVGFSRTSKTNVFSCIDDNCGYLGIWSKDQNYKGPQMTIEQAIEFLNNKMATTGEFYTKRKESLENCKLRYMSEAN